MEKKTSAATSKQNSIRRFKLSDIIVGLVFLIIIVGLLIYLLHQLGLKNEVAAAKTTSDRIVSDIRSGNAADARKASTASFQKNHSERNLKNIFQTANTYAKGTPIVASQTVTNVKDGQNVGIVYQYSGSKPFYIRVIVTKPKSASSWQLAAISGGNNRAKLENNQN